MEHSGSPGAISGWLRPKTGWVQGTPTIDVEFADLEPRWHDNESRWPHDRSRRLKGRRAADRHSAESGQARGACWR